jgi:hypothetical protein
LNNLQDDYQSLCRREPDQTPLWEEQRTSILNQIEIWESIMEKVSIGAK